jgi:putative Mn2+ efflux pump MntP
MTWIAIFGVSVGLAMDAFAVSIAAGLAIPLLTYRHVFRLAFHFGLFQFLMPVVGWLAGRTVATYVGAYDHWIAFAVLTFIGAKMLWESAKGEEAENLKDPTRGLMLVTLSIATSLDALAVGLSMAFMRVSVWMPSIIIGLVAGGLTLVGIRFGSRIGAKSGRIAASVGGLVLVGIGVRILVSHLA